LRLPRPHPGPRVEIAELLARCPRGGGGGGDVRDGPELRVVGGHLAELGAQGCFVLFAQGGAPIAGPEARAQREHEGAPATSRRTRTRLFPRSQRSCHGSGPATGGGRGPSFLRKNAWLSRSPLSRSPLSRSPLSRSPLRRSPASARGRACVR